MSFGEYIVYVDETGDHGLKQIDPDYPLFGLAFCVFHKEVYTRQVVPALVQLKFDTFGHDMVVLHEHAIRKRTGDFKRMNEVVRDAFLDRLNGVIQEFPFTIIAVLIDKVKLEEKYRNSDNPYTLGVTYGLERLYRFLKEKNSIGGSTHVIFEARGSKEDRELELEFRRVCDGNNCIGRKLPFEIQVAHKRCNSAGLQLADLVARPIGLSVLRPDQSNRAMEIINKKIRKGPNGEVNGYGLKVFP